MVELAGIPPFGGGGVNIRPNSDPVAQAVPAVEAAVAGQGMSGRMSSGQSQTDSGAGRQPNQGPALAHKKPIDRNAVPGPPPTFEISLLEMDRDLAETLARMNAAHAIARDATAVSSSATENRTQSGPVELAAGGDARPDGVGNAGPATAPEADGAEPPQIPTDARR